jgi:hypothetical protein
VPSARADVPIVFTLCDVDPVFMYGGSSDPDANGPEEQEFWEFSEFTCVATPTPTNTPVVTDTPVPTNTPGCPPLCPTNTPTDTPTNTPTPTDTPTNTPVPTDTPSPTPTNTPDATATFNAEGSLTPLATNTPTPTNTPAPTNTPVAATNTPSPTNTSSVGTATPTNTAVGTPTYTPSVTGMEKVPEGNGDNADLNVPKANLWLCEAPAACAGPGEGNLLVIERASNVQTGDQNGDSIEDGLGAYEFTVEYDNFVIASVNPCDIVFGPGGAGASRGPVDELDTSDNPYCLPDPGAVNNGTCAYSLILENLVHFGCVTNGQLQGPTGSFDVAALNLIPHPDLRNDVFPGNNNGVLTVIKDNGCELVDVFGHPITGSINGGLTPDCGDLAVTVRILEGDMDLDCDVDVTDAQLISYRYGAFFGGLLYSKWYDLEPELHDLDIDIKDIQKVFGREGSTCQSPIPAQPPVDPPVDFD